MVKRRSLTINERSLLALLLYEHMILRFIPYFKIIMKNIYILLISFVILSCHSVPPELEKANQLLSQKKYIEALNTYRSINKKTLNQKEQDLVYENTSLCLYMLAKHEFDRENYWKAKEIYLEIISIYPYSDKIRAAKKELAASIYFLGKEYFDKKKYQNAIELIRASNHLNQLSKEQQTELDAILADSLFSIAKEQLKEENFYFASRTAKEILLKHGTYSKRNEVTELLEEASFKDAKKQLNLKAYSNSYKVLKNFLLDYPDSKYKNEAKALFNKAESFLKQQEKLKKKAVSKTLNYFDKGDEKNPLTNEDLDKLIVFLNEKKERNPEWAKKEFFPLYYDKIVNLKDLTIESYTKHQPKIKKQVPIAPEHPLKKLLTHDPVKEKQMANALKYKVNIKNKSYIILYLDQKSFLNIDFRKKEQSWAVKGKIKDIQIIKNKIIINIVVKSINQK